MLLSNVGNLWGRGKDGEEETGSLGRVNIWNLGWGNKRGPEELEKEGVLCKKLGRRKWQRERKRGRKEQNRIG